MPTKLLSYCFLMLSVVNNAQITFEAIVNKPQVEVGDRLQINFVISAKQAIDIEEIYFPEFKYFQILGKNGGTNISLTNGKIRRQYLQSVMLFANKAGKFTIPAAKVKIDGELYESNDIQIVVLEKRSSAEANKIASTLGIKLFVSEDEVYPNQSIIAEVKIFAKSYDALRKRSDLEVPGISGFQVKRIPQSSERNFMQEVVNGEVLIVEHIARFQLTPTKAGQLKIPTFKIRIAVPVGRYEEEMIVLKTNPQTISVKEFPPNSPANFSGAIGKFKINTFINDKNAEVNQPIDYEIELIGEGNLGSIYLPKISLPAELELYPAKRRNAFTETLNGQKGKIVDSYVIVPQYGGKYTIPELSFTFFNPENEAYETIETDAIPIHIAGETKAESDQDPKPADDHMQDDKTIEDSLEISNVQQLNNRVKDFINIPEMPDIPNFDQSSSEDNSKWYWLLLPILGIPLILLIIGKRKRNTTKKSFKSKNLSKSEIKTQLINLKNAAKQNDINQFTTISTQLLNNLIYLFSTEKVETNYSLDYAKEILSNSANKELMSDWANLYNKNLQLRYATSVKTHSLASLYTEYEELVKNSLNELR